MTIQEFKTIAKHNVNTLSTAVLIAEVKKMSKDFSEGVDMVLDAALEVLESRMPESEFIALCNEL